MKKIMNSKVLKVTFTFLIVLYTLLSYITPTKVLASEYDMPNGAINADAKATMVSVTTKDVDGFQAISSWMSRQRSYIFVRKNEDGVSHYFNTPNIQKNIYNALQQVNTGGWMTSSFDKSKNVYKNDSDFTTASKKYGYTVPYGVYIGERPVVTISLTGIVDDAFNPLNVARVVFSSFVEKVWEGIGWVAGLFGLHFGESKGTEFTAGLTENSIKNVHYFNPDYTNTTEEYTDKLANWLKKYWEIWLKDYDKAGAKVNDVNILEPGFVISVKDYENFKDMPARDLLGRLINKAGTSYDGVLENFDTYNSQKGYDRMPRQPQLRNMPYELDTMSPASREYMKNIPDPRVEMFNGAGPLGTIGSAVSQVSYAVLGYTVLNIVSFLSETAATLNSICDITFLGSNGISITQFWGGSIGQFLLIAILIGSILFILVSLIKHILIGNVGGEKIIGKAIMTLIMAGLAVGLLAYPKEVGDVLINTTSKILSIGTVVMNNDGTFQELYTDSATDTEKSELRYWYMYHSVWTKYVTNHSISDDANKFNISEGTNEYKGLKESQAKLTGKHDINLWSVNLLENMQNNDVNSCYRTSDHFLAPNIIDKQYPEFDVEVNKHFNGYMFSDTPFGGIFAGIAVLIMTVLKLFCFVELVVDIMLLIVRFVVGAFEGSAFIKDSLKSIGQDIIRVISYDLFITIFIYSTVRVSGFQLVILALAELAFSIYLVSFLLKNNNHLLCPGTLIMAQTAASKIKASIAGVSGFGQINKDKEDQMNKLDEHKDKEEREDKKEKVNNNKNTNNEGVDYSEKDNIGDNNNFSEDMSEDNGEIKPDNVQANKEHEEKHKNIDHQSPEVNNIESEQSAENNDTEDSSDDKIEKQPDKKEPTNNLDSDQSLKIDNAKSAGSDIQLDGHKEKSNNNRQETKHKIKSSSRNTTKLRKINVKKNNGDNNE